MRGRCSSVRVSQNSAPFHLTSNAKGVKLVKCNAYLMEVVLKKMLVFGNHNISDDVALQFEKETSIAAIYRKALLV